MRHQTLLFALGALALAGCDSPTAPVTAAPEAMVVGGPRPPVLLRPVSRIAFTSDRSGDDEIYAMYPDGSGVVRLTNDPGFYDAEPAVSPDGHKVAFASFHGGVGGYCCGVYVMSVTDGSGLVYLNAGRAPAWSPDGAKIAFTRFNSTGDDIYVMNANGSGVVQLTTTAGNDNQPAWSPDGSKIAFSSTRDGNHDIYVMNADGSGVVRLTNDLAWTGDPAWSPDGSKIAFSSNAVQPWNSQIYVMNADGSGRHCVSNNAFWDYKPTWSSDGSTIAFTSRRDDPNGEIYVMSAVDGSGVARLTTNPAHDGEASWGRPIY